jgi:Tfp pilus assembly protein PilZ
MTDDFEERRQTERVATRSLVEVKIPDWEALRSVYAVNLSLGGIRLQLGSRAPLGAALDIILTLPNGSRLHLAGKVAHLGPEGSGDVGVRFDDLPDKTKEEIEHYIRELGAGRTPPPATGSRDIPPGVLIKKTT